MPAPRPVARPRKQGSTNQNSSTVLRPPFRRPSWADLEFGYLSKLGLNSQGFHKKWHLRIKSLGTPKATQGSPCPAGAAARRARQRQVNRWHIHDSPSQARGGGRWERPGLSRSAAELRVPLGGRKVSSLHLPSVPAGGKGCRGAHLLIVLMPTIQLRRPLGFPPAERSGARPGSLFFSRS